MLVVASTIHTYNLQEVPGVYTGIDKHKDNSFLTTVNDEGIVVKQERLDDLLSSVGIELTLAHAKYLKAIAYAEVKTDKVDSEILAQLLRMNYIYKMRRRSNEAIARTVVAKELARIVYYVLKNKTPYRGFKGQPIQRHKSFRWPRLTSPVFVLDG
jgi:hypothetical protein